MDSVGVRGLAAAIVMQALTDYKQCVKIHKTYPEGSELRKKAEAEMERIMGFAKSGWFLDLSIIPQSKFIAKLKELEK